MMENVLDNYYAVMILKNNIELLGEAMLEIAADTDNSIDDAIIALLVPQVIEFVENLEVPERL